MGAGVNLLMALTQSTLALDMFVMNTIEFPMTIPTIYYQSALERHGALGGLMAIAWTRYRSVGASKNESITPRLICKYM